MGIYISVYLLPAFLRVLFGRVLAARNIIYYLVLVFLFLFSAFRYEVGCDWFNYLVQFDRQDEMSIYDALSSRDPLWWLTLNITNYLNLDFLWVNIFSSFVFLTGVHILAKKQPDRLGFLIFIYPILFILMAMSGIRQATAIGFVCMAYAFFIDRKIVKYSLSVLIASGFHFSAIVFLSMAIIILKINYRYKIFLCVLMGIPFIYILSTGQTANLAVDRYVNSSTNADGAIYRVGIIFLTSLFFLFFLNGRWKQKYKNDYFLVLVGSIISIGSFPVVFVSSVISDRMSFYLIPIHSMIMSRIPYIRSGAVANWLQIGYYVFYAIFLAYWMSVSAQFDNCYIPYRTWLEYF